MLVMCATTTFAQTAITSAEDVKPGKVYWFENSFLQPYGGHCLYYTPTDGYNTLLWCGYAFGAAASAEDVNQQYAFVEFDGQYYLYSLGADKFATMNSDTSIGVVDIPYTPVKVQPNDNYADFPYNIVFNESNFIAVYPYTGYQGIGYMTCNFDDPTWSNAAWQIYEVADLENADELTERLATAMTEGKRLQEEAYWNLMYKFEEAEELLSDLNYQSDGGGKIELQVEDPYSGNYIWCNEPEMSEGPIEQLIDGIVADGNFFHSAWNGTSEPQHWLQIDLEDAIQNFSFEYYTRQPNIANDFPDGIEVMGSNDGTTFETIAVFDEDLPQGSNKHWASGNIYAEKAYKHLRFVITVERVYFHMAEFALYESANTTVENEAYAPYIEYLTELVALTAEAREFWENNANATAEEYDAYTNAIAELMDLINGLVTGADDEKTVAYVATVEEIYALEGVGYPGEAPRAALKEVLDAAKAKPTTQARLDLEVALAKYIKTDDITLPTNGEKYTLTFVTYGGRRNFLNYEVFEEEGTYALSMVKDTITTEGLPLPETAAFTCVANEDGTFDFQAADGKYFTVPGNGATSGSATGISEYQTYFQIQKMHPNSQCEADVTEETLFGLVALYNGSTYMAPNSSGSTFYHGSPAHFKGSWTSAMRIEPWTGEVADGIESVVVENNAKGTYDLTGRKVANPTKGIYVVNGKKVLVK